MTGERALLIIAACLAFAVAILTAKPTPPPYPADIERVGIR